MSAIEQAAPLTQALERPYLHGFVTDIESDSLPPGLDEGMAHYLETLQARSPFKPPG